MRNTILSAVTSSILLGAVVAQAGPRNDGGVDSDGDGRLSQAEWSQVSPALSSSFGVIDTNSDGQLTTEEFAAWHDSLKARVGADAQAEPAAAPDQDAVTRGNVADGPARITVNRQWNSGKYYPNAVGTVGDDPAKPKSTTAPPNAKVAHSDTNSGPSNQWANVGADLDGDGSLSLDELTKVSPILSASFSAMDVDSDQQVSHGEFRSWHESLKVRMGAE